MYLRKVNTMATEFVTDGHPDKICDQISDAIVDAALEDESSRVGIEVAGGHGGITITGEITTNANVQFGDIARNTYKKIGHEDQVGVFVNVVKQSPDIAQGVNEGEGLDKDQGAGDQGVMVGYAINEGSNFMPKSWTLSRQLCVEMRQLRRDKKLPYLRPDGKSLVVMEGDRVTHVTLAAHHSEDVDLDTVRSDLIKYVVIPVIGEDMDLNNVIINGTGTFTKGGFEADAGVTGRKLMVDNYGPNIEIGGGCYSGKDPSKVDRSSAYFCRMVAKSIVAGGHANEAVVKVGYAIGISKPAYITVVTDLSEDLNRKLEQKIIETFDFRPRPVIDYLNLLKPDGWKYQDTSETGHYGDNRFPWEKIVEI